MTRSVITLSKSQARRIWLRAQKLDSNAPFGGGPQATPAAVQHLGYVQIDTINVIERCHHHILYTRIPDYRREHLHQAQTTDKTVFEYWGHALAYLPTTDFQFHVRDMRNYTASRHPWLRGTREEQMRAMVARIRRNGPLTIRDIDDEALVEKTHAWMSRKPSKAVLQLAFNRGLLAISERVGMLKTYELTTRHFGWKRLPPAARASETTNYIIDRALSSQGLVSIESACHLDAPSKPAVRRIIESRTRRGELIPVEFPGSGKTQHWVRPETLAAIVDSTVDSTVDRAADSTADNTGAGDPGERVHILSPFDPLIIQRKRLALFFDYQHRFEAYVPKDKRVFGYFACPVLVGTEIVAALDLKTDRARQKLLIQKWTWVGKGAARAHRKLIEPALHRFERFQLAPRT
jgi:uncharacterized protein YcaQ